MGKQDKLISKLKQSKQTFKWNDLVSLLELLGVMKKSKWRVLECVLCMIIYL